MWAALQHTEWVTILATSRWLFGLVSVAHYVALFSYVETYLNDGGVTGASDEELAEAAKYAARLLAAHPRSAGAEILRNAQPAQPQ